MSSSWERRRLAGQEVAIAAGFVLALFGTLRLSPKAVVGFILLPPGRRRSQGGWGIRSNKGFREQGKGSG